MLLKLQFPPQVPAYTPLLVAYSGGADSRLLLSLAKDYGDAHGIPVYAAHLHHGIRGAEADRDLEFCRRTAEALGVPLFEKRVDVPGLSRLSGQSLEAEARAQRYAFFHELMEAHGWPVLLTAHHADDQLETLLHRFLRGSGTRGISGIPEVRPLSYGLAVRPLLSLTKAEILAACAERGLDFVTDSTNREPFTIRNRLRREIIPTLEAMTGEGTPQQAALRLSRAAREDDDCLMDLARAQADHHTSPDGGLSLVGLQGQPPAIAKRMMALLYERVTAHADTHDGSGTLSAVHLEALCELVQKGIPETSVSLPRGMEARVREDRLYIRPPDPRSTSPQAPCALSMGDTPWDGGQMILRVEAVPLPSTPLAGDNVIASAVFPASVLPLSARSREAGDIILSHGMHKKLKKLLCDKNVPPHMRDRLPLICHGEARIPLWYPTVAFADGYPPPTEGEAVRVSILNLKNSRKEDTYE